MQPSVGRDNVSNCSSDSSYHIRYWNSVIPDLLCRFLPPIPIPGIPYDEASIHRLLADIPDLLAWQKVYQEPWGAMVKKFKDLDSPIVQIFARVGRKPWAVIAAARE